MGYTWISEAAWDHSADADSLRAAALLAVPRYEECPVEGCTWEGTDGVSLAEHMSLSHPIALPRLLLDGKPARATQYLRHAPSDKTFAVEGGAVLEYQVDSEPWRTAGGSAELGAVMAARAGASDWSICLRSSAYSDLRISYQVRVRVLPDGDRRPIDKDFLERFSHSHVAIAEVLDFRSSWNGDVLQQDYAGTLADCMQWLVDRGMAASGHRLTDASPIIRRLALHETSVTAAMMSDVLRFCEMNVREPATQTVLPSVTFALDWLHAIASRGSVGRPDFIPLSGDSADSRAIFVDGATQELLDRVVELASEDDLRRRAALASDLVAWASADDRLPSDREKAHVFAIAGAPEDDPERSCWASGLVHHPDVGQWALGVIDGEVGE